jgi:hypothetical protein
MKYGTNVKVIPVVDSDEEIIGETKTCLFRIAMQVILKFSGGENQECFLEGMKRIFEYINHGHIKSALITFQQL